MARTGGSGVRPVRDAACALRQVGARPAAPAAQRRLGNGLGSRGRRRLCGEHPPPVRLRSVAINTEGLLYTTRAALPHLLQAAKNGPRRVADIVNISSIAGRVAWTGYGVYNFTKFGVNGFTESLRQEVTQRHVRIGVVEPGGVATELGSHNKPAIRNEMI